MLMLLPLNQEKFWNSCNISQLFIDIVMMIIWFVMKMCVLKIKVWQNKGIFSSGFKFLEPTDSVSINRNRTYLTIKQMFILTCYLLHSHFNGLRFCTGLSNSIHINSSNTELILTIAEKVLDMVWGAVTRGQVIPCVVHGVPDLQVVWLDDAAPIVSGAVPGEGEWRHADVGSSRDAGWGIWLIWDTDLHWRGQQK